MINFLHPGTRFSKWDFENDMEGIFFFLTCTCGRLHDKEFDIVTLRSIDEKKKGKQIFTVFVHEFLFQSCTNSSISRLNCMKTTTTFIELLRNGRWLSTDRIESISMRWYALMDK